MLLVTGGTGFIGSHLVDCLAALGCRLRCLVRRGSSTAHLPQADLELAYGDLVSGDGLAEALRGVQTVFHLAGVRKSASPAGYYQGNARATENLVRAAAGVTRFVHVSSLAAAGPAPGGTPLDESAEPRPVSDYGRSKLEAEHAVRESPLANRAVILRPAVVYGPRDRDLLQLFRSARRGLLPGIGGEERYFSAIYIRDLVEGVVASARIRETAGRTYFLAHPEQVSWSKLRGLAAALAGRSARTVSVSPRAARLAGLGAEWWARLRRRPAILSRDRIAEACCPYWLCDSRRAGREMGFTAATALDDGLAETLDWYREAGWLS
jgi:nucleoside-diphosphate-sugar epimerase